MFSPRRRPIPDIPAHPYRTVTDLAFGYMREQILNGAFAPGEKIDQEQVARALDVSRMPVREALRRLEAEGLVTMQPHRGATVAPLHADEIEDLYLLRSTLEGLAGRLATTRLDDATLLRLRSLVEEMEELATREESSAWLDRDGAFHETLYAAANRPQLVRFIKMLCDQAGRYRQLRFVQPGALQVSAARHRAILDACERRDGAAVERHVRKALRDSKADMLAMLEQLAAERSASPGERHP